MSNSPDDEYYAMTLEEIGQELGICKQRVHQLEKAGLRKLRLRCAAFGLELGDFVDEWRRSPSAGGRNGNYHRGARHT